MLGQDGLVPAEDVIEETHKPVSSPPAPPAVIHSRELEERRRKKRVEINRKMDRRENEAMISRPAIRLTEF
jgi:hypothetical protein